MKNFTLLLFMFCAVTLYAQSYPKYSTKKVKDTVFVNESKVAENASEDKAAVEDDLPKEYIDLMEKAGAYYKEKQYDEAIKTYTDAFAVAPVSAKYLVIYRRAACYFAKRDFNKAIQDYTLAIEKAKMPHKNALGQGYLMRGLSYGSRSAEGDNELKCADLIKAREIGVLSGDKSPVDEDCY